jgi:predicted secreted hydrolase
MKKLIYLLPAIVIFCLIYLLFNPIIYQTYINEQTNNTKTVSFANDEIFLADNSFVFPKDHGAHNDFNSEWWYFSGNLSAQNGRRFGYELAIFRAGTFNPLIDNNKNPYDQKYMAHFALTDIADKNFYYKENLSLSPGINAGADANPFKVWLGNWVVSGNFANNNFLKPDFHIQASTKDYSIDLNLNSLKPLVLQGEKGISRKGQAKKDYSYYYSLTRLSTTGKVQVKGIDYNVSGLSWMDHEWSNSDFGRNENGWDWFSIQLNNNTEIMFYQLRNKDGGRSIYSEGTLILEDGKTIRLNPEEVKIEPVDYWESEIHAKYPSGWKFSIPDRGIYLMLTPYIKNQELELLLNYWEGAVSIKGKYMNKEISGSGYVELTGYKSEIKYLH